MKSLRSSLGSRLVLAYVAALLVTLVAFGVASVFAIDRSLRASLDEDLRTTAQAGLNFVDVKDGQPAIDSRDRTQLLSILEPQTELAILDRSSTVVFSTTAKPSVDVLAPAEAGSGLYDARQGGATVRALVLPIDDAGQRIGSVVVWTTAQWIGDTDRRIALAFLAAALLVAVVAAIAGSAVTHRALDRAFALQRKFTADASHELRAPLSVIRAEADLALRTERNPHAYRQALDTIATEADRMERLVSSLLSAARAEHAHRRARVDLQALTARICERLLPAAKAKGADIKLRLAEPCYIMGDPDALESAATAVLHNAIKYTPPGSSIETWIERSGRHALLYVQDAGPGLSAAALEHGLEWFWCGDEQPTEGATGVGLAVANSVARAGGGHVTLGNAPGGGARIAISLPAVSAEKPGPLFILV
jgi:signal transduction histidine kinase